MAVFAYSYNFLCLLLLLLLSGFKFRCWAILIALTLHLRFRSTSSSPKSETRNLCTYAWRRYAWSAWHIWRKRDFHDKVLRESHDLGKKRLGSLFRKFTVNNDDSVLKRSGSAVVVRRSSSVDSQAKCSKRRVGAGCKHRFIPPDLVPSIQNFLLRSLSLSFMLNLKIEFLSSLFFVQEGNMYTNTISWVTYGTLTNSTSLIAIQSTKHVGLLTMSGWINAS